MQQAGQQGQQGQQGQGGQQGGNSQQQGSSGQQGSQQSASQQNAGDGSSERSRALERLREADNMLNGQKNNWDQQRLQELGDKAENLNQLQAGITDQTKRMASQGKQSGGVTQGEREALSGLVDDKIKMLDELRDLEQQLNQSAARMSGDQKKTAADLRSAAGTIQDERMADKVRQGAWLSQRGLWPTAAPVEEDLKANLDKLKDQIGQAQRSFQAGGGGDEKLQRALETAERVRQGLEAMGSQPGQQGQQGQNGQQGQQGQNGQRGQQGQPGQGQQGQGGQGNSQSAQGSQQGGGPNGGGRNPNGGYSGGLAGGPTGRNNGNAWNNGGYNPQFPNRPLTAEEQRGLDQQFGDLQREAAGLRGLLSDDQDFARMAQDLVRAMQNLDAGRYQRDPQQLENLRSELTDRWKDLELRLRRELQMEEPDAVRLATQERVPEKYRAIVEEYYRSISKSKK
jgi:hypothetical protein